MLTYQPTYFIVNNNFKNLNCVEARRDVAMKKWVSIFLALAFLGALSFGCAGIDKQAKVKCPKCGAVFTIDEGVEQMNMYGPSPKR